ncbi:MAG TPA: TIGR00366 family protein [Sandaracinaceae bacterium LLY-WYZ-13_1]|nr:TIGR00366 family protein [Sandaracinaceae bacterium LLY-WYZ-13_1]
MLRTIGQRFESFFRATAPDPFVLAVGLTLVVFGLAMAVEGTGPLDVVRAWQGDSGFWSLLAFSMQMVLILVTGHALAATRPVRALIHRVARWPRNGAQAAALVAAVAIACALLNWGLGLIVGALLAREVGRAAQREGTRAHYPLLVAAGYSGLMCWHGGFSGTAPLKMTTAPDVARFLGEGLAGRVDPVPFTETVLGAGNLVVSGGLLVIVPLLCYALAPRRDDPVEGIEAFAVADDPDLAPEAPPQTVPERIERSPITMALIAVPLVAAIALWFHEVGIGALDPNAINLIFLTAGLLLHGSLARYAAAVGEAVKGASGIVLQFPFYAGIMGVMRTTGLAADLADFLASHAPAEAYTVVTFLSSGLVNLFVPSGGGQWAVQGPIAVTAARELGLPIEQAIMAVAYGDQWTNMLQPFWALPLLAITGIRARDILGYTALFLIVGGLWMMGCLFVMASLAT